MTSTFFNRTPVFLFCSFQFYLQFHHRVRLRNGGIFIFTRNFKKNKKSKLTLYSDACRTILKEVIHFSTIMDRNNYLIWVLA